MAGLQKGVKKMKDIIKKCGSCGESYTNPMQHDCIRNLKDKLHRRNMQIKDLKEHIQIMRERLHILDGTEYPKDCDCKICRSKTKVI